jgi:hypothetical protein
MSPSWHGCELQASLAVVERDAAVEGLIDAHFGTGEAEAAALLGTAARSWTDRVATRAPRK